MPAKKLNPKRTAASSRLRFPISAKDLPASRGMLRLVRSELRSEMKVGFSKMDEKFSKMDERFAGIDGKLAAIDGRFAGFDGKFAGIDSRFNRVDASIEKLSGEVSQLGVLIEEQASNNRIVLEGLTGIWEHQERLESTVTEIVERSLANYLIQLKP